LSSLIEDTEHLSVYLAVATFFDEGTATAFDRLQPYFDPARVAQPGGDAIPNAVLSSFVPSSFTGGGKGKEVPHWNDARAPVLLREDLRWIDLCVSLRRDAQLGDTARYVLRYADPALVHAALGRARAREVIPLVQAATRSTGDLLTRYLRGEFVPVWNELRSHEALGGDLLDEAREIARETMLRVARNADQLAERLAASGWVSLYGELRTKPQPQDREIIRRIEEATGGPFPLSPRAFWEIVGGINFVWNYRIDGDAPNFGIAPDLPLPEMDPLCVDPPEFASRLFEEWEWQKSEIDPDLTGAFSLDLAPDDLHKANVSGGPAYAIELPFYGVDPIFANEGHDLPFVDYLRRCFRWAGFPVLERYAGRPDVQEFLRTMGKGLEPF
jgi:hypothetical protein